MSNNNRNLAMTVLSAAVTAGLLTTSAHATHFRGAAVVPTVDASGLVTVDAKSFWRRDAGGTAGSFPHDGVSSLSVNGPGLSTSIFDTSVSQDITDIRRAEVNETFQVQLPGAGLYTLSWSSGSWVNGVPNASGNYGTSSTIYWDGSTGNAPIIFDLENIQQEVIRGQAYTDNLDAIGVGLTYNTNLSAGMSSQASGFGIDATGQIDVDAASTAGYADNGSSPGADRAFSGEIHATDGSSVEFVWLFDAVDTGSQNLAPSITDIVINGLVGDTIDETLIASDPDGDPLTTAFLNFVGTGGVFPGNSTFDPNTMNFVWDSTGFGPGTYIATFNTSDGSLSDQGTITINLRNDPGAPAPIDAPATLFLLSSGLLATAAMRRRNKK